jgi:hypothetical protein
MLRSAAHTVGVACSRRARPEVLAPTLLAARSNCVTIRRWYMAAVF